MEVEKSIEYYEYDCFISHAYEDKDDFVRELAFELKRLGFKARRLGFNPTFLLFCFCSILFSLSLLFIYAYSTIFTKIAPIFVI